jgi:hypothetical protein
MVLAGGLEEFVWRVFAETRSPSHEAGQGMASRLKLDKVSMDRFAMIGS